MLSRLRRLGSTTFRSLRIRNFRLYFFGQLVSMTGTWMQSVAQAWLVLQLTESAVAVGITTGLQFAPMLFGGPWGGLVADRVDKRRMLLWTQVAAGLLALTLGLLAATDVVTIWMVYALAFGLGCTRMLANPTRHSFYIEMVGPEDVSNAVALNSALVTSSRIVGPAAAGLLIAAVGVAPSFLANGASYVAVVVALAMMDTSELRPAVPTPRGPGQVREGIRYAWSARELRVPLVMMAIFGTFALNYQVVLPLLARYTFEAGADAFGGLYAFMSVGSVIGAMITAGRPAPTRRFLVTSAFVLGLLVLVASASPTLAVAMAVLVPVGAANTAFIATTNSMLQLRAPDEMRGRVMALYNVVFLGTRPIGGPLIGWIAGLLGARVGLAVGGAGALVAGVIGVVALGATVRTRRHPPAHERVTS